MSIFKENDIRGLYPAEWNVETAFRIGHYLPDILPGDQFVVGRDGRESSREIYDRIICGLRERGKNVTSIGIVDTPAVYFAAGKYGFDGGVMVTASHNPPEYNGIKLIGRKASPIGYKGGLEKLERLVEKNTVSVSPEKSCFGKDISLDIGEDYAGYLNKFFKGKSKFKVVLDCSNGSMGRFIHQITKNFCGETVLINDEVDGSFPSHGPNPTLPENITQIRDRVLAENADAGFCFDGDGDRVVMVNEKGETVSPDLITAILGLFYLKYFPVRDPEKKGSYRYPIFPKYFRVYRVSGWKRNNLSGGTYKDKENDEGRRCPLCRRTDRTLLFSRKLLL